MIRISNSILIYGLPIFSCTLSGTVLILQLSLVHILVGAEHCEINDCDEGFFGYREVRSFGSGLCCLNFVDVLGDAFGLE